MPKVSVIIPCYNLGLYLDEAVDSVLAQTMVDFEIIVVDDGSTDAATCNLLADYQRPKMRVLRGNSAGVSSARNRGIAAASGEYILPLDADDRIAPVYLEKAVAVLESRPEVGIVYCEQMMFGERSGLLCLPDYDSRRLLVQNLMHASAVFRKTDWEKTGGYCEAMTSGWEDWEFWIAMSRLGIKVVKLTEPLFYYRIRASSRDNTMELSAKFAMLSLIFRRHRSLYCKNSGYVLKKIIAHLFAKIRCVCE